ncbi:MAG: hypothetical protein HY390_03685 [Deltaproteobacteria bacterium]|nr:hypothetical protein [Deltaproteobacteria bacterium]
MVHLSTLNLHLHPDLVYLLIISGFWACYTMIFSSIPSISSQLRFESEGNIWVALNAGTIVLGFLLLNGRIKKISSHWLKIKIGMSLFVISMFLVGFATDYRIVIIAVILLSLGEFISGPSYYYFAADFLKDSTQRARHSGVFWATGAVGEGMGLYPEPRSVCILSGLLLISATIFGEVKYFRKKSGVQV